MPQGDRLRAGQLERVDRVAIAVAAREDDDADADGHAQPSPAPAATADEAAPSGSIANTSMSGFDRSSAASRSTIGRAAAASSASTVSSTRRPTRTLVDPLEPEVAEAALDRATRRVEDARALA